MMVGIGAHGWCKKIEEGEGSFLVFLWKMKTGWCFQLVVVVYGGSRSGKGWGDGTMDSEGEFVSDGVIFYYWEREKDRLYWFDTENGWEGFSWKYGCYNFCLKVDLASGDIKVEWLIVIGGSRWLVASWC